MIMAITLISATALACTFVLAQAWVRTAELGTAPAEPRASAETALAIECASLRERVRKLERIADGVDA